MANEQKPIPRIRTFETDIENCKKEGISLSDVVVKQRVFAGESLNKINMKKISLIAILVLAVAGSGFGLFKYFSREKQIPKETPKVEQIGKPYIKADLEKILSFSITDPNSLTSAIKKELETQRKVNSLLFLMLQQTLRGFSQFTGIKIPESLIQASDVSFNVFTAYHTSSSSIIFLIKIENFEKAYSSMLSWEKDMWQGLSQFLNEEDIKNINQFSFSDEIIRNHDSRVLKNQEGKAILAYAIFNKQFVVISTLREGLSLMLQKLIAFPPK